MLLSLWSKVYVQPLYNVRALAGFEVSPSNTYLLPPEFTTVVTNVISSSSASATISNEPLELPVDAALVIRPRSSLYVIAPDTIATSSRTA